MANPLQELFFGSGWSSESGLVETITPRRTFEDVILPEKTRRALDHALSQIENHDLIYNRWGLGERHPTGTGLAFNFAGPPGTGKTICAEAVAHALGRKLLITRYAEMESMWVGNTGKNVETVFQQAERQKAVLFFDEADAIAGQRFTNVDHGYQREANAVINVMLRELENFRGVVIFATNLAANLDPAFERRIRTHILFRMPDAKEREQIWKVQLHDRKTPLAGNVDFKALGEQYEASGGDIKNAVLKAAQMAGAQSGPDHEKRIHQHHFEQGIQEVVAAKDVMDQSLFDQQNGTSSGVAHLWQQVGETQETLQSDVTHLEEHTEQLQEQQQGLSDLLETMQADTGKHRSEVLEALRDANKQRRRQRYLIAAAIVLALAALALALVPLV